MSDVSSPLADSSVYSGEMEHSLKHKKDGVTVPNDQQLELGTYRGV